MFKSFIFILFQTLLHPSKTQLFCFHAIPRSFAKTPGVGRGAGLRAAEHRTFHVPAFLLLSTFDFRSKIPTLSGLSAFSRNFPSSTLVLLSKCRFATGEEASSHVLPQAGFLRCRTASDAVYQSRASHRRNTASHPIRRPGTSRQCSDKSRSVSRISEAGPLAARARHQFGRPRRDGARQRPPRTGGKSSPHGQP